MCLKYVETDHRNDLRGRNLMEAIPMCLGIIKIG